MMPIASFMSVALPAWYKGEQFKPSLQEAKALLESAGYKLVDGKLHYPDGKKESLQPLN